MNVSGTFWIIFCLIIGLADGENKGELKAHVCEKLDLGEEDQERLVVIWLPENG